MKLLIFQLELLSDVVLPATSNTEGKIDQLDFIAGSNFLGMVAKAYPIFEERGTNFDIFHSGNVRFGDAHILKDGKKKTYKIPYSYFHKKLESEPIYNHHLLEQKDFESLGQLKQLRNGYMTIDKEEVFLDYSYSQKSGYDREKRRSKDSQMYGYNAIQKGSKWQFTVSVEGISTNDEKLLIDTLTASKRIGRSKSAEYGEVEITYIETKEQSMSALPDGEVVLYCNSRLALIDENAQPTYNLDHLCKDIKVVYEKTQIRTSQFTPYNGARHTKDYERVCINKGSVIVVEKLSTEQLQRIQNGVGAYLSEGFGELLINPSFLLDKELKLIKECKDKKETNKRQKIDINTEDETILFLKNRHNQTIDTLDIANEVASFVKDHKKSTYSNIKPSQWGNIRSIASSDQDNFIKTINDYIKNGSKKWEEKQVNILMNAIKDQKIDQRKFTKLLAMKMGGKND